MSEQLPGEPIERIPVKNPRPKGLASYTPRAGSKTPKP